MTFDSGTTGDRREFLRNVSSNRTLTGSELSIELASPFCEMVFSPGVLDGSTSQHVVRTTRSQLPKAAGIRSPKKLA
ncbi:MAG: hypothetical protein V3S30_08730, partial [Thermoanaerobaculia bacterium]